MRLRDINKMTKMMKPAKEVMGEDYFLEKQDDDKIIIKCISKKLRDKLYNTLEAGVEFSLRIK